MKRVFLIFIIAQLIPFSTAFGQEKPLLISGMTNYPPVMWADHGKYVGIAEEIARKIFNEIGVPYEFKILPWERAQKEAKSGEIDVISGIYWNDERSTFLNYSKPFMGDPAVLFVRHGHQFPYLQWSDLIGKKGIVNRGYSWGEAFDRFMADNLKVIRVEDPEQAFKMLSLPDRRVDYYLYGLLPGMIVINRLNLKNRIDYIPTYVTNEKFYIAFSKKSSYSNLIPKANAIIERLVKQKTVDFLFTKYIDVYQKQHSSD